MIQRHMPMKMHTIICKHKTASLLDPVNLCTGTALAVEPSLQRTVFAVPTAAVLCPAPQAQPGVIFLIVWLREGLVHAVGILSRCYRALVPVQLNIHEGYLDKML